MDAGVVASQAHKVQTVRRYLTVSSDTAEGENGMPTRRAQRRRARLQKREAQVAAKANDLYRAAPTRIRGAAKACLVFGGMAVLGGISSFFDSPAFEGAAYTEIVSQLAKVFGGLAWLAAVVLFTAGALLNALADILVELRRQTPTRSSAGVAPPPPAD